MFLFCKILVPRFLEFFQLKGYDITRFKLFFNWYWINLLLTALYIQMIVMVWNMGMLELVCFENVYHTQMKENDQICQI